MDFLPVSINVTGKKIVLIGGGKVANKKIRTIKLYTDNIFVVAEQVCEEIKNQNIPYIEKQYDPDDLKGFKIVYACTNNKSLNQRILDDAHKNDAMVNVADSPGLCDFISPAIYKNGNISVAVSSNATDPGKSVSVRNKIKDLLKDKL